MLVFDNSTDLRNSWPDRYQSGRFGPTEPRPDTSLVLGHESLGQSTWVRAGPGPEILKKSVRTKPIVRLFQAFPAQRLIHCIHGQPGGKTNPIWAAAAFRHQAPQAPLCGELVFVETKPTFMFSS
jgi:hypothetical protein